MTNLIATLFGLLTLLCFVLYGNFSRRRLTTLLPPGPKPLPFIGNILDFPSQDELEFRHWLKHKDKYGPLSSVTVLGRTIIIIHDREIAHQLLEKQSAKSAERPQVEFASVLCGLEDMIASRNNEDFRLRRRLMHRHLGTEIAVAEMRDMQQLEVAHLLLRIEDEPASLLSHLKTTSCWTDCQNLSMTGSLTLRMTYGYQAERDAIDPLIKLNEEAVANATLAAVPGAWLVDVIPLLKHVPGWVPGVTFKHTAQQWKRVNEAVANIPYTFVKDQIGAGTSCRSYVSESIRSYESHGGMTSREEHAIKWSAGAMYLAGANTATALSSFVLAMVMFPAVQQKAQEEIDRVMAGTRLPNLEDRKRLSYVDALVKEVFRWSPAAPMGLAHMMSEDTLCNGYTIPQGAILLPAVWWLLNDPDVYREPSSFQPQRYLGPDYELDPRPTVFGYGRRVCPGRLFADETIFLAAAQILSSFALKKATDEHGEEVEVKLRVKPGIISEVMDFPFEISARGYAV